MQNLSFCPRVTPVSKHDGYFFPSPIAEKQSEKRSRTENSGEASDQVDSTSPEKASTNREKAPSSHWLMKSEPESRLEKGVDVKVRLYYGPLRWEHCRVLPPAAEVWRTKVKKRNQDYYQLILIWSAWGWKCFRLDFSAFVGVQSLWGVCFMSRQREAEVLCKRPGFGS